MSPTVGHDAPRRRLASSVEGRRPELAELVRLGRLVQANDPYLHGHSRRVARHAVRIARGMGVSPEGVRRIRIAAELHDIGKLHTPRAILHNPGRLSDAEYAVIKRHAANGAEMLEGVAEPQIVAMVRHHHERIDGSGYPDRLGGQEIPLGARVIAVADTYDAITSARSYRRAATHKHAIDILSTESGRQLDAAAVTAFLGGYAGRRQLAAWSLAGVSIERAVYAFKILLAGPALPAIGASALLAASPILRPHGRPPAVRVLTSHEQRPAGTQSAVQRAPVLAAAEGPARKPSRATPRARSSPARPGPTALTPGARVGSGASPGGALPSQQEPAPAGDGAGAPQAPATQTPAAVVSVPTVTVPAVATPATSTPVVTTPSISTPAVTTPAGTVPAIGIPAVKVG